MKKAFLFLIALAGLFSCSKVTIERPESGFIASAAFEGTGQRGYPGGHAGILSAGEWNDLEHWGLWSSLMSNPNFLEMAEFWGVNTSRRVAVRVADADGKRLPNVKVELKQGQAGTIWSTVTDNLGEASLWVDPFHAEAGTEDLAIVIDGVRQAGAPKVTTWNFQQEGADVNFYQITGAREPQKKADLAFIVDATGSMGDEIAFLKKDLMNILDRVKGGQGDIGLRTGTVFYRDEGDDYVTKYSQFTDDYRETIQYIAMQNAQGGGDHPEAVHTALSAALQNLDWNASARSRIAFLILDAPAHQDHQGVIESLQKSLEYYAKYGIKIIPVFCSSPTKECEFMCRDFAILTGGTYVFLTDDSGVGGPHLQASVGEYQTEHLNDLLVRLIAKYIG